MDSEDSVWRFVVPAMLVAAAAVLLFVRLDEPARIIFDETYYVNDALEYLDYGVEASFAVHPPVGKWLIAASIAVFGDNAVGWRAAGALSGALTVLLTYLMAMRLFRHVGYAALAALLLATDGLFLVQARTSMLDIHLALFVALGAYLLLVDFDRSGLGRRSAPDRSYPLAGRVRDAEAHPTDAADDEAAPAGREQEPAKPVLHRGHGFRVLAGVAFGLALATKWSGVLALGGAGLLVIGWELALRRRLTGRWFAQLRPAAASILVSLVLVPLAVYAASYLPWLANYEYSHEGRKQCEVDGEVQDPCAVTLPDRVAGFGRYQKAILDFHLGLEATHPYRAPAYTWPVMSRPVVYYWETCSEDRANRVPQTDPESGEVTVPDPCVVAQGEAAEIIAVGNPALWWAFLGASALLVAGLVRRDPRAGFVAAFYGGQFLPWLIVSRPAFFFYMVPVVPFLALGVTYGVRRLGEPRALLATGIGAMVGAAAGLGIGLAVEAAASSETSTARWLALGAGWLLGAGIGAVIDRRREPVPPPRHDRGRWAAMLVAVTAVALFVYFLPVWTGVHLPEEVIKQRWWLRGWI